MKHRESAHSAEKRPVARVHSYVAGEGRLWISMLSKNRPTVRTAKHLPFVFRLNGEWLETPQIHQDMMKIALSLFAVLAVPLID